jgi:hypothetical protein
MGNAPVCLSVEVLTALTQQCLHAKQSSKHRNRRDGVGGGFGEAGAWQERFKAIL